MITGSIWLSFESLVDYISNNSKQSIAIQLIWKERFTHTSTALFAGLGLSLSGLIMQSVFRNPLAGPYVLGVSSGASLGVAILLLGGVGFSVGTPIAACIGAMSGLIVISIFAQKINSSSIILILGLMMSYFTSAFTSFLLSISSAEEIQSFSLWGLGSFSKTNVSELLIISIATLGATLFFFYRRHQLNLYVIGDEYAKSLGVNTSQLRILSVIVVGIVSGLITAYCGPIAFVGMAVPHLARNISKTANHKNYIILSLLIGAIFMLCCDILSSTPFWRQSIPINSITCILGAPIVIWVLTKMNIKR